MADNDDITCQLTRDDCIRIHRYIVWLEEKARVSEEDNGVMMGAKAKNSIDKIIDGIYE